MSKVWVAIDTDSGPFTVFFRLSEPPTGKLRNSRLGFGTNYAEVPEELIARYERAAAELEQAEDALEDAISSYLREVGA